ncbi:MAG: class I SAM-dependent methyltransferase [Candidatus Omnitrophota bacterium]|nr:class I SAM-dependent methyltransferase [Candidatus Omnitrophota bacterium]
MKILEKFQNIFFKARMSINAFLGLPAQTGRERGLYRKIFDIMGGRGNLDIFEWGSGFSTVYYAQYLRKRGIIFTWDAIDNNNSWAEKVRGMIVKRGLKNSVSIHVKEFPAFWEKPGWDWSVLPPACGKFSPKLQEELAYIAMPGSLGRRFDIVFIDARFRRHCLKVAKEILKPCGIIVMHDAQKQHYHEGMADLTFSKFFNGGAWVPFVRLLNKVWLGSFDNKDILGQLVQWEQGEE